MSDAYAERMAAASGNRSHPEPAEVEANVYLTSSPRADGNGVDHGLIIDGVDLWCLKLGGSEDLTTHEAVCIARALQALPQVGAKIESSLTMTYLKIVTLFLRDKRFRNLTVDEIVEGFRCALLTFRRVAPPEIDEESDEGLPTYEEWHEEPPTDEERYDELLTDQEWYEGPVTDEKQDNGFPTEEKQGVELPFRG